MMRWLWIVLCAIVLAFAPAFAAEERPVNFVFLIDVSGSMLYPSTMVTAADGSKVTLFEALRQALKEIVQDPRLIGSKSHISFITFGTKITEMSDWPARLEADTDRQRLIQLIESPTVLNADKHGDTYMGGALQLAEQKANSFYENGEDPCATTFIVMLTDGWDEPPAGGTIKVRSVAQEIVQKEKQVKAKLGVNTWQVAVIGLQRLPDKKAGTTTAKEVAHLLGGEFLDVTKQAGKTVSESIFLALKQQVEKLKGQINLGKAPQTGIEFGTVNGNGVAQTNLPVELKSCYPEEVTGLTEASPDMKKLPPGAITLELSQTPTTIAPVPPGSESASTQAQSLTIILRAHNNCPAGHYSGCFKLESTAKVPACVPWKVSVPERLVTDPEEISLTVRKPGFFWAEATSSEVTGALKELPGSHAASSYTVDVQPQALNARGEKESPFERNLINDGKTLSTTFDTTKGEKVTFRLPISVPARQTPGKYKGKLDLKVSGPTEILAPSEIPIELTVEPSPWEQIAPIAVPIIIATAIAVVFAVFLWLANLKRSRN